MVGIIIQVQNNLKHQKVLHFVNVSVSLSANCILQNDTVLLQMNLWAMTKKTDNLQQTANTDFEQDFLNTILIDHDYFMKDNWCVTEYATEIITYIHLVLLLKTL